MAGSPRSYIEDIKAYIGFSPDDARTLRDLAPLIEPHLVELGDRFYERIPGHPDAERVFKGGQSQIARLKMTLQGWARGLFSGTYDDAYAEDRFRIGYRHVQIGLPQRFVIAAMCVVEQFIRDVIDRGVVDHELHRQAYRSLSCVLSLDLNLICETYFDGSLRELRNLNDALASANRSLEEANRVKGEFLATVSHELRTPLTAIIGFSKLLVEDSVTDSETRREFSRDVHAGALALLTLVDEILDLARVESGRFQVHMRRVDLACELDQALAAVAIEARRKQLVLENEIPAGFPPVLGDDSRVRQVLINLLANAVKFTERGSIRVRSAVSPDLERAVVHIEDTGIGIATTSLPLLFEKFRQVDVSHTRRHGGLGLGLAISKALIDRMGGSIEITSPGLGQGTVATVSLPLAAPDVPAALVPAPMARLALLVGAEQEARPRLADTLAANGFVVRHGVTIDGVRALSRSERFDLLLLDADGAIGRSMISEWLDLLVALKVDGHSPGHDVIVLSDTGKDEATRVQLEVLATSSAVVAKADDPDTIEHALSSAVSRRPGALMRVLIVDDDPLVFRFVTQILPSDRYALLHAKGGYEGVRMAETHPCDAILLDLRMRDGSGYDLIRELKLRANPSGVPIIVLTNYPEPTHLEERQLLHSRVVLDVVPKTAAARDPRAILDRLETLRRNGV